MRIRPTDLAGVAVVETDVIGDERGDFARLFCARSLAPLLGERRIVEINRSRTRAAGTIRGLHFQHPPHAETKFVRCLRGRAWDVAVDLRAGSPTFLRWHAVELSADNTLMAAIPEGCAHGFQALAPDCELLYLHTAAYAPAFEAGVAWDDPRLDVAWPLPESGRLSQRDRGLPRLAPDFPGLPA